jgi:hypothetical protein
MTSPPSVTARHDRYDRHICTGVEIMAEDSADAAGIERRLRTGAWLRPGEVGILFGKSRWAVDYWLRKGVKVRGETDRRMIGFRESPGGWRECDPDDVSALLDAYRTRRTSTPPKAK